LRRTPRNDINSFILRAFVGIAHCYGLESFRPEGEVPIEWLAQQATTLRSRQAVCFWAVVGDEAAREIRSELDGRHRIEALTIFQSLATEIVRVTSAKSIPASYSPPEDPIT
jgi:hypothetical protein